MSRFELDYSNLLIDIMTKGVVMPNRTGVDASTLFNRSINIDLCKNKFPILTRKKMYFDKGLHEFNWFMSGSTNVKYLNDNGIHWWNEFADENGELGLTYGYQLRHYNGVVDQLDYVLNQIKLRSRRAHISLWNPGELESTSLPVCYTGFDFVVIKNKLNMSMDFRSSDVFLGLPYDIIVGALMLYNIAKSSKLEVGVLGINIKNAHIYVNHLKQCITYLERPMYKLPKLNSSLDELIGYEHSEFIKAKLNN